MWEGLLCILRGGRIGRGEANKDIKTSAVICIFQNYNFYIEEVHITLTSNE